ncbi:hypothetical protein GCM10023085_36500 [Actinomadura viridis]
MLAAFTVPTGLTSSSPLQAPASTMTSAAAAATGAGAPALSLSLISLPTRLHRAVPDTGPPVGAA